MFACYNVQVRNLDSVWHACGRNSDPFFLTSLPVNYSGLQARTLVPRPPPSSLANLRTRARHEALRGSRFPEMHVGTRGQRTGTTSLCSFLHIIQTFLQVGEPNYFDCASSTNCFVCWTFTAHKKNVHIGKLCNPGVTCCEAWMKRYDLHPEGWIDPAPRAQLAEVSCQGRKLIPGWEVDREDCCRWRRTGSLAAALPLPSSHVVSLLPYWLPGAS